MSEPYEVSDRELLRRAVQNARPRRNPNDSPRWVVVMDLFGVGSTYARLICRQFDLDPEARVARF